MAARSANAEATSPASVPNYSLYVWEYSLYKTITYETAAGLADVSIFNATAAGAEPGAGVFFVASVGTAAMLYYMHEVIWNYFGPARQESASTAATLGLTKTLTYRVVSTTGNLMLSYAIFGNFAASLGFALISNATSAMLYFSNEFAWYAFGPTVAVVRDITVAPPEDAPVAHPPGRN